jgi:hypothetical protein
MRWRSSATAWSASASLAASSCSISTRWRRRLRPRTNISTLAAAHGVHAISSWGMACDTTIGATAAAVMTSNAFVSEPRCHAEYSVTSTQRNNPTSRFPSRHIAVVSSTVTRTAVAVLWIRSTAAHNTDPIAATTTSSSSPAVPGSVVWATTTIAVTPATRNGSSLRSIVVLVRARSARHLVHQVTGRGYDCQHGTGGRRRLAGDVGPPGGGAGSPGGMRAKNRLGAVDRVARHPYVRPTANDRGGRP